MLPRDTPKSRRIIVRTRIAAHEWGGRTLLAGVGAVAAAAVVAFAAAGGSISPPGPTPPAAGAFPAPDHAAAAVLAAAHAHIGDRYVYGGTGPTTWDCSGLTSTLWRTVGGVRSIPRTAAEQQAWATPVPADQARPGDLVFFDTPASHVAFYEGGGWIVDASASLHRVVERPLWTTAVMFGRVPRPTAPVVRPERVASAPNPPAATSRPTASSTATHPASTAARADRWGLAFVRIAETHLGARYAIGGVGPAAYDDAALLSRSWKQVIGHGLPLRRDALAEVVVPISAGQLAPGDVLVYGAGSDVWHVAIYAGHGMMVDSSRSLGRVVLRPVLASSELHFGRLVRR